MTAFLRFHDGQNRMRRVQETQQIGRDHPPPVFGLCPGNGTEKHEASAIHQNIQSSPGGERLLNGYLDLPFVRDVHVQGYGLPSFLVNAFDQALQLVDAASSDSDAHPAPGEGPCGGLPNARGSPRHEPTRSSCFSMQKLLLS